jgi:hypothetical protein
MMSAHLSTAAAKLWRLFNFHLWFYYNMVEAPSSTFNIQPSSPPTSTLIAIEIPNPPSLCYFVHSP